jgi:alanine racemase
MSGDTRMTLDADEAVRPSWMEIDLGALVHNAETLREQLGPDKRVIAALKGDAYGHGIGPVARCLARCGIHSIATGSYVDAQAVRSAGVDLPILMFAGPLPAGMGRLLEHGLTPTVHDETSARAVSAAATAPAKVFLKVDVGLRRLGVPVADALAFVRWLCELPNIELEGIYTHLTFNDAAGREWARERLAAFDALLVAVEAAGIRVPVTQALASAALLAGLTSRANAVCPGSLLYGISPVAEEVSGFGGYRPVACAIKSRLIQVRSATGGGRAGVIPLGLADGYRPPRPDAEPRALLGGVSVPITGVSLEYIGLDLGRVPNAAVGDEVVLLGESGSLRITLADIAAWQGAPPHEVLMGFEGRLRARYRE